MPETGHGCVRAVHGLIRILAVCGTTAWDWRYAVPPVGEGNPRQVPGTGT